MINQLTIGLFGFGCVGQGLYEVLKKSVRFKADFKKICIKHPNKKRMLDSNIFTTNKWELLNDPEINTIVELIDDAEEAYQIIVSALKNKKNVVTANKKVLAFHLEELVQLQKDNNVSLIYEASACGGIPIIRTLEEYYDNEELGSVSGIYNGSSNFVLSKIYDEGFDYSVALKQAQDLGFAETDPTLDMEGFDPKFKLIILALHAYGIILKPSEIFNAGISQMSSQEIELYKLKGIKAVLNPIIAKTGKRKIQAYVLPQLINAQHRLANVNNEYNAVIVQGSFSDEQLFIGKGAGGHPTGAAVLSDISALSYGYKYGYKKYFQNSSIQLDNSKQLYLYFSGSKSTLVEFFDRAEIAETEKGCFVVSRQSVDWLMTNRNDLHNHRLFIARINEGVLAELQEYYTSILTEIWV